MTSCRFSRWRILDFRGPIMGSLKSPFTTSYRSSIETIALNCFVFEKISFLQFGDRQTDKQTNRWTRPSHEAALAVASGGLIRSYFHKILSCPLWCVPLIFDGIVWRLLDGLRLQFSDGRMMNDTSLFLCCARPHFSLPHSLYLSICRWMCVCVSVCRRVLNVRRDYDVAKKWIHAFMSMTFTDNVSKHRWPERPVVRTIASCVHCTEEDYAIWFYVLKCAWKLARSS